MNTIEKVKSITGQEKARKNMHNIRMARGYICPKCGYPMYAVHEDPQSNGKTRVTYQCRSCNHTLTVFE